MMNFIALYVVGAYVFLLLVIGLGSMLVATVANHFRRRSIRSAACSRVIEASSGCGGGTNGYRRSPDMGQGTSSVLKKCHNL